MSWTSIHHNLDCSPSYMASFGLSSIMLVFFGLKSIIQIVLGLNSITHWTERVAAGFRIWSFPTLLKQNVFIWDLNLQLLTDS